MSNSSESNPRLDFFRSQIGQDMSRSVSPLGRWLNGTLLDVTSSSMKVQFTVQESMTNPMGVLHGGAAAAIMDDTVGALVFSLGREYAYTSVNLNCDFLNPARLGEVVTAEAHIVRAGKNVIHCECTIWGAAERIIAKCSTNLVQTSVKLPF